MEHPPQGVIFYAILSHHGGHSVPTRHAAFECIYHLYLALEAVGDDE